MRRAKWISAAAISATLAGGYGLYLASAQSAPPVLAQAPLNITNVIPPAFIMAVDDSGSMTYQVLLRGLDGAACWDTTRKSFFNNTSLNTCTQATNAYWYIMPHQGYTTSRSGRGLPPLDAHGFARSHELNPSYFNPYADVSYGPWLNSDGSPYTNANTDANGNSIVTSARANPLSATTTFNFTDAVARGGSGTNENLFRFELRNGMVLPAGMQYYTTASCGGLGTSSTTRNTWVTVSAATTVTATCTVGLKYFAATFYLRAASPAPEGYLTNAVAPDSQNRVLGGRSLVANACGVGCDMYRYEIRPENYNSTAAYNEAIQKYANWFTYYGNRNRAMIAGMTRSMVSIENMRVGYFTLKERSSPVTMYDMKIAADKQSLYNKFLSLPASGGTPNLLAVNHIGQQFSTRTDSNAPVQMACQKNAGMLFTDGFSNDGTPGATAITGLSAPFDPTPSGSMAAIASRYYFNTNNSVGDAGESPFTSLPFPAGRVPVPAACGVLSPTSVEWKRLDCQSNLHMNFYGITLGARGNIFDPDASPEQDPFTMDPAPSWPAHQNDQPSTVDDIWHATVNTRGDFINARTPADITAAMRRILAAVNEGASPAGTIGVTGARIGQGSLSVTPSYESANEGTDWYGRLQADLVSVDALTNAAVFTPIWEASAKLAEQGASARTIRFGQTGASVVPNVADFTATNVTLNMLCADSDPLRNGACRPATVQGLGGGSMTLSRVVAYLRGESVDEGVLRNRTSMLGDIVNSSPAMLSPTDDYGYSALGGTLATSYQSYLQAKRTANRSAVLVGANDGMFHIFDAKPDATGGSELFAYIPATSIGHMGNLVFPYSAADQSDQKFIHRYFVDGPITISDVYDGTAWRTIAVGTSGAGGRSVFALDVSDPTNPTVLWEINDLISGNSQISDNMGYVLGRPVIVPVKSSASATPTWKVLFGNGYNSESQQAALFVVDAITGATSVIEANESIAPSFNGLGNIVAVDVRRFANDGSLTSGGDGYSDTVYAADQNGAVWKFDLQSNSVGFSGSPLFVAEDASGARQSILGGLTAARGPRGGVMVYFGTGSFSFVSDTAAHHQQSLYAILDTGTAVTGRGQLSAQTVGVTSDGLRTTSTNAASFSGRGWYLDLPMGERFVGGPRIESGVVFFPVYAFSSSTAADCSSAGSNWLYGLDSMSGAAAMAQVRVGSPSGDQAPVGTGAVVLETGGSAPVKDLSVLAAPRLGALDPDASDEDIENALNAQCSMVVRVAGAPPLYLPRPCGRQSWRQLRG